MTMYMTLNFNLNFNYLTYFNQIQSN